MKNDTQNAANPADNAELISEPLTYFKRRSLISIETSIESKSNAGVHIASMPLANEKHAELFCSAPRLKRERDELLAAAQHLLLSINNEPALRRLIADSCPQASENLYNAIARIEKGGAL